MSRSEGGIFATVRAEELDEGLRVEHFANSRDGFVTSLLIDARSERVIGHVVTNDAGMSDAALDSTIDQLFPADTRTSLRSHTFVADGLVH